LVPQVDCITIQPAGADTSFLLIHGFAASTDQMTSLAEFLADNKIASFSVKIAGHGDTPEKLADTTRSDWYKSVKDGLDLVKSWNKKFQFVAGLSLGGALALKIASEEHDIDGLVVLSPAVFQKGILQKFLPILKYIMPYRNIDLSYIPEMYEIHYWRLDREPLKSLQQLLKVMNEVQRKLASVRIPTLIIQSGADKTINPNNGQYVFDRISSEDKELRIIGGAEHVLTCHSKRFEVFELILEFIQRIRNSQ
jgi:carboxylesterase